LDYTEEEKDVLTYLLRLAKSGPTFENFGTSDLNGRVKYN